MAEDYGVKIAKQGFDVKTFLTELNKKNFNILSTEDTLLKKELSSTSSDTNMFLGYKLVTSRYQYIEEISDWGYVTVDESHPLNGGEGTAVYVIYENLMP